MEKWRTGATLLQRGAPIPYWTARTADGSQPAVLAIGNEIARLIMRRLAVAKRVGPKTEKRTASRYGNTGGPPLTFEQM